MKIRGQQIKGGRRVVMDEDLTKKIKTAVEMVLGQMAKRKAKRLAGTAPKAAPAKKNDGK